VRRRLLPDVSGPASARFRRAALVAAALGYAGSLRALAELVTSIPELLAVAVVVLAPVPMVLGALRMRRFLGFDPPPPSVMSGLSVVGIVVLLAHSPPAALPGALCALQGHLLVVLDDDRAAAWSPAVAVLQVLTGLTVAASPVAALLVPAVVIAALAAELLLLARVTRRAVERRALGAGTAPESTAGADRRLLYAIPLAALLLAVGLGAAPLASTPPWELFGNQRIDSDGRRNAPPSNRGQGGGAANAMSFGADMAIDGIPMPAYEVLMEVVPRDGGVELGDIGPLYLRGIVLAHFTPLGVRMRGTLPPTRYRDFDDGFSDGVTVLRDPEPGETIELELSHYPLPIEPQGWNLLFGVEPVYSVTLPSVRYDPDRLLVSTDIPDDWFSYTIEVRRPDAPRRNIGRAPAFHPDERNLQLPEDSPDLQRVYAEGRRITDGATSDLDRVQKLVEHFRSTFEYSLEDTTFAGPAGLAEFLDRESGFCTQYASACVLMLREQGLPARVVTGFLASEWSDEQAAYEVRPRDTHAWFEVHFEGVGWVPFEATPNDLRRAAALDDGEEADAVRWAGSLLDSIGSLVAAPEGAATPREVLELLKAAPLGVKRTFLLSLLALALTLVYLRVRGLFSRRMRARVQMRELDDLYGRILRALAKRGYHKRAAQTPREFARAVVHAGGVTYRPIGRITEDLYAARFGERPLDTQARGRIDGFLRDLKGA
jgi:transglutaminase-like putative cysteine protease